MIADFFTKPLQGSLFLKFREVILGYEHTSSLQPLDSLSPEERVGKNVKDEYDLNSHESTVAYKEGVPPDTTPTEEWHTVVRKNKNKKNVTFTGVTKK